LIYRILVLRTLFYVLPIMGVPKGAHHRDTAKVSYLFWNEWKGFCLTTLKVYKLNKHILGGRRDKHLDLHKLILIRILGML